MKLDTAVLSFVTLYAASGGSLALEVAEPEPFLPVAIGALGGGVAALLLFLKGGDIRFSSVVPAAAGCMAGVLGSAFMTDWFISWSGWFDGYRSAGAFVLGAIGAPALTGLMSLPYKSIFLKVITALLPKGGDGD